MRTHDKASNDKYGTVADPAKLKPGESDPDQTLNYEATLKTEVCWKKTSWLTINFEREHHEQCCGSGSATILIGWTRIQVGKKWFTKKAKLKKVNVLKRWMFYLEGWRHLLILDALHWGLGINTFYCNFDQTIDFFQLCTVVPYEEKLFGHQINGSLLT